MKKQYRLIKQYPGSGAVGTITELTERMNPSYFTDNPDFYEEVIEKDYEILISRVVPQEILSVKRLSDGEIFTVGDRAKTITSKGSHDIRQFRIRQRCTGTDANGEYTYDGIDAIWIDWEENCGGNWLESTVKLKQPIFLTHDGKDIFDGDKLWYVNKRDFYKSYFIASKTQSFFSDTMAYFLTREDAENYIEKKKVLFTTDDGVEVREGDIIHGIYKTTFTISNTVIGNNNGVCNLFVAVFSTRAAAENYVVQKSHSLSIEDFWEFVCWGGSNIAKSKRLKRLVKERLNLK